MSTGDGGSHSRARDRRLVTGLAVLGGALGASVILAAGLGPSRIPTSTVVEVLASKVAGGSPVEGPATAIVWELRVPRALLAAVCGASLAVAGTLLQAMVRNPLADPAIMGGTSGAGLGAVAVLLGGWAFLGPWTLVAGAFVGSVVGYGAALKLAEVAGRLSPLRVILAGVAVSYAFGSLTSFLVITADEASRLRSALFWTLGSVAGARWDRVWLPAVPLLLGLVLALVKARPLNALAFGDETSVGVGIDPDRLRIRIFLIAALLTGATTALVGGIGFVGLVVPHVVRMVVGGDHRRLLPLAALSGGVFLVWADVAARVVMPPQELPIGIITSFLGAPVFAWLLRRRLSPRAA